MFEEHWPRKGRTSTFTCEKCWHLISGVLETTGSQPRAPQGTPSSEASMEELRAIGRGFQGNGAEV